ncbi:MAG: DUF6036 family nucleotidyltransferase [Bacteroidota bacterium]
MDVYDDEFIALWSTLAKYHVRYIMIGGFAVNLHKFYRTTADIDLYIEDTSGNRVQLGIALEELGISTREIIERMQFVPGWSMISLLSGFPLDMMTKVKGLEYMSFGQCYDLASSVEIDNIPVKFLHINHLIESKKAANRPKDQIDILALEEIKKLLEERGNA